MLYWLKHPWKMLRGRWGCRNCLVYRCSECGYEVHNASSLKCWAGWARLDAQCPGKLIRVK